MPKISKAEVASHVVKMGYRVDRYGHYRGEATFIHRETQTKLVRNLRICLKERTVKIQRQLTIEGRTEWLTLASAYYGNGIHIMDDGRLRIGSMLVPMVKA